MSDDEIERLAVEYEDFGFGRASEGCDVSTHGFDPEGLLAFAREIERRTIERCAAVCEARYMGDNNREDGEAMRCAAAIRALAEIKP